MTFRKKLFGGFSVILIIMALGISISISKMADLTSKLNTIVDTMSRRVQVVNTLSHTLLDIHQMEKSFVLSRTQEERRKYADMIDRSVQKLNSSTAELYNMVGNISQEKLNRFNSLWEQYLVIIKKTRHLVSSDNDPAEVEASTHMGHQLVDDAEKVLAELMDRSYQKFRAQKMETDLDYQMTRNLLIGFLIMAIAAGMLVAAFTTRGIITRTRDISEKAGKIASGHLFSDGEMKGGGDELEPVYLSLKEISRSFGNITRQAQDIARDDLSTTIELRSEVDELGLALQEMTESLRRAREENRKQAWLRAGQNELNEKMRGEQSLSSLACNIITFLANYLGAQIGALYTLDEDRGDLLMLSGSYAFHWSRELRKTIRIGEGLAGQAALEKVIIPVTNVPRDYPRISSAIGDSLPRHILVIPFLSGGMLKGVAELGSFHEFSGTSREFLELVRESVAIAIHSAQSREKIQALLEESQRQAEELQVQQKELQTANEELEEQTQALKESEENLKNQQEELQAANEELEEKAESLERQRSEIERKNAELEAARRDLEEKAQELIMANKYKSEFLANMSHELRTPLNSLLILAQSLANNRDGNLTDHQVESLRIIYTSGTALLELINDILDLSKIEAGRMDINFEELVIHDLAEELRSAFQHVAEGKGLALKISVDQSAPQLILTDRKRAAQIVRNLISNAIKFTDQGEVTLSIRRPDSGESLVGCGFTPENTVAFSVTDTGIGIPPEKQRIIFESFQQAEGGTARKYGGTGLGLSISRNLAHLLGGDIHLSSTPGQGSTFTLYLPVSIKETGKAAAEPAASQPERVLISQHSGIRAAEIPAIQDDRNNLQPDDRAILIIEDDQSFSRILMDQCHEKGFKCLFSTSGEGGLELAQKYQPKAIILDILLPGMDGWQVMEALKRQIATRHIPVHVMSVEEKTIYAFQKGAIGFLTKPVSAGQLIGALTSIEETVAKQIKDLLVVEDDPVSRKSIVRLIGNGDVQVTEVGSGAEAIQAVKCRSYDCMVLDLGLPDMSGFQVLQALEKEKDIVIPPVIIYTGRDLTREEDMELRRYAESIIVKGVKSEERLLDETALFLHRVISNLPKNKQEMITTLYDQDVMLKDKRILLVDDDMKNAFALAGALRERGMKVLKAEDGQKALHILRKNPDIDLVLMDVMMPVMDGYETIRKIRAQQKFWNLPVIALTAKAMREDREKCLAAGANDYLSKPIDLDRLISMMRVWLYR
ncbi:MAG: response regulator [bacterium]